MNHIYYYPIIVQMKAMQQTVRFERMIHAILSAIYHQRNIILFN